MGRAKRVIAFLWLASCLSSSPALFSKKVTPHYWEDEPEPYLFTCNSAWPNEALSILYSVYLFLLLFFIPLIVVSFAYMSIAFHLNGTRERSFNGSPYNRPVLPRYRVWYRNTSGWSSGSSFVRRSDAPSQANGVTIDEDATEVDALRSEPGRVENLNNSPAPRRHRGTSEGDKIQRVITMLAIVVALFILSWGPLLTYTLIYRFIKNPNSLVSLFLHLVAACNSCINPIIYAFLSKNFRQSFKQVIRDCCCCCTSLNLRRQSTQPSFRWTSSTRASYSYAPPESCMRNSPQRSTTSCQKTDV